MKPAERFGMPERVKELRTEELRARFEKAHPTKKRRVGVAIAAAIAVLLIALIILAP